MKAQEYKANWKNIATGIKKKKTTFSLLFTLLASFGGG